MATPTIPSDPPMSPNKWVGHSSNPEPPDIPDDHDREPINSEPLNGEESMNGMQDRALEGYEGEDLKGGPPRNGIHREKQINPNKVYIGGLPEHTRQEDLQSCFGKIGDIKNIELKLGYGFVEFESHEAADESVAKYDGGFFMGNKIRVELSHGGGRTAKHPGDPGACFKCGQMGHWARECPNHVAPTGGHGPNRRIPQQNFDNSNTDRMSTNSRDYAPPPPREYAPYREEYRDNRYPPARDSRYGYDYPTAAAPPGREYGRPGSPPRDYYPPPQRATRDYDDYRSRGPPPPRGYYENPPTGYSSRGYEAPNYDRGVGRRPAPSDRYPAYQAPTSRPRTPPGVPPVRGREEYERPPHRDYMMPPAEFRGRTPPQPGKYPDYAPRPATGDPNGRFRRRSQSPPRAGYGRSTYPPEHASSSRQAGEVYRSSAAYASDNMDPSGYAPSNAHYSSAGYSGNGYSGAPMPSAPLRQGGRDREYPARGGGDLGGGRSRRM